MKYAALLLLFSLPGLAQSTSNWVRGQFSDKLSGDQVVTYQLFAQPDPDTGRKPYIAITCDLAAKRFTYGYFTDEMVYVNTEYASVSSLYYPTTVEYRTDSAKVKRDAVTVRPDFRTIDMDAPMMSGLTGGNSFAISFPSLRGYMVTDVFPASPLPAEYAADCTTDKTRKNLRQK